MKFIPLFFLLLSCSYWNSLGVKGHKKLKRKASLKMAWAKVIDKTFVSGNVPIGYTSPTINEDFLYVGSLDGKFRAYDLESGRELWKKDEKKALGSQAIKYGEQVVYGSYTGRLYSRHYLTGELKYVIDLGQPIESTPFIYKDRLFLHLRDHSLMSLDASNGKILWKYKRAVPFTTTFHRSATPIGVENKVIVGFADGFIGAFSVDEGVLLWELQIGRSSKFVDVDTKPLFYNGKIWAGSSSGPLALVNPNNGSLTRAIDIAIGSDLVVIDDKVYAGSLDGNLYILNKEGTIIKKAKLSKKGISSVQRWGRYVAVATYDGDLKLIGQESLAEIDNFYLGTESSVIFGNLTVRDEYLSAVSSRNRLYVFKL